MATKNNSNNAIAIAGEVISIYRSDDTPYDTGKVSMAHSKANRLIGISGQLSFFKNGGSIEKLAGF